MNGLRIVTSTALVFAFGSAAAAQQAPARVDPSRTVTLSLAEYNRLIDLGNQPPPRGTVAPVPAVLAAADLQVRVDAGAVRGVFNLTGEILRDGVARVPLVASATLIDATADGRPVPLVADNGTYHALVAGPGPFALALDWGAPLTFGAGRASFVLPVPKAGAVRATLDLPGDQADVHISPGLMTGRTVVNQRTLIDVTLDPGSVTSVWWSMRDSVQAVPTRQVRASAEVLTLVTLGDSDVRLVALVDVTVLQGELRTLGVKLPPGYDLTGVSGSSIATSTPQEDGVQLTIGDPAARSHQFLVSLERSHAGGSFALETGVPTIPDVQRERGEIAVEGVGTFELTAEARDGLHRLDVRELSPSLQALGRLPLLSAFRYQRTGSVAPVVALDVKRFADAGVLAAVADRAEATTLVTAEGRALTEVKLHVQNRAQPFLKVLLPPGATMVSVDVAGESAKPVAGADGTRVPLLRPGFRPGGSYDVSFVYLHAGAPLARKGDMAMALPRLDMPVGIVEWEVFVPDRYSAQAVDGNALDVRRFSKTMAGSVFGAGVEGGIDAGFGGGTGGVGRAATGRSADRRELRPAGLLETVTVAGQAPMMDADFKSRQPSENVISLQRRTSGVLPIRVDVPRAGTSHRFVKPLVIDQETTVTLRYSRR